MDCENFRMIPTYDQYERPKHSAAQSERQAVQRARQVLGSVPTKPSKKKRN